MSRYYFTRRAFLDLEEIYRFSVDNWGEHVATSYIDELFSAFQHIAQNPTQGIKRHYRSSPFLMAPAGKHYAIYERFGSDIIIATVIHSKRAIETLIKKLGSILATEILHIREQITNN